MLSLDTVAFRLALAIVLGGILGLERELRHQPAGFRTHIVLCVGAALITMVSSFMAVTFKGVGPADPTRIAAQIVTGIGFLGAGAILRLGVSVRGLTTAANLWTTAGLGMAVGTGFYYGALLTTGIILIALTLFRGFERVVLSRKLERSINLTARIGPNLIGRVEEVLASHGVTIKTLRVGRGEDGRSLEMQVLVEVPKGARMEALSAQIASWEDVFEVEIL